MLRMVPKQRVKCARYVATKHLYIKKDVSSAKTAEHRAADSFHRRVWHLCHTHAAPLSADRIVIQRNLQTISQRGTGRMPVPPTFLLFYFFTFNMLLSDSYIYINDIRLHALHGVLPQEQLTGNDYIVNIRIGYDIAKAFASDDVADTLNYAEVYNIVKEEMLIPSKLIEHVAGRIANRLMEEYAKITSIVLHITKCNPPMGADCQGAGVEIHVKR